MSKKMFIIFIILILVYLFSFNCTVPSPNKNTVEDDDSIQIDNEFNYDAATAATTVGNISSNKQSPYINITESSDGKYHVKINLRPTGYTPYSRVEFAITPESTRSGFQVNIGNSISNNGWGGDYGDQQNDSEIFIKDNDLMIYANDKGNTQRLVYKDNWLDRPVYFTIKNNYIRYTRYMENGITLENNNIFCLNGQTDSEGPVDYIFYAAFNRVIDGEYRSGTGIGAVTINFYDPIPANVYYGQIHNHSTHSDGNATASAMYTYARDTANYDFFGLADHSYYMTYYENNNTTTKTFEHLRDTANSFNIDGSFVAFYGFEWTHDDYGHVAVINKSKDSLVRTDKDAVTNFEDLVSWLNQQDCIAFFNHPGRQDQDGNGVQGVEFGHFQGTVTEKIVGMELWNKTDGFEEYYYNDGYIPVSASPKSYYDEAINYKWRIGASGALDYHGYINSSTNWPDYRVAVLSEKKTRDAIYNGLENRRFYTTNDVNLKLWFQINDYILGDIVNTVVPSPKAIIKIEDPDNETITKVQIYRNGFFYREFTPNQTYVYLEVQLEAKEVYSQGNYYIKVTQADGDEAISSPIFLLK